MPPSSIALTSEVETNSEQISVPTLNNSNSNLSQSSSTTRVRQIPSRNYDEVLKRLPSSPKDLIRCIDHQRNQMRLLQEENLKLKSRELEVSTLTMRLQQQFAATQSQVASLKANIQMELTNPITQEEYDAIMALPEGKRDLLDTIKVGIYRHLGSLQCSMQAAAQRTAELATAVHQLTQENKTLKLEVSELEATLEAEKQRFSKESKENGNQRMRLLELEATVKELEGKLKSAFLDQEQFLAAKMTAQLKTDEVARLSIQLEEAELDVQRYKANAECNEQKLDILKSEYYELKLHYSQRNLELESALKSANEKLKSLNDLEMESELFISNMAARIPDGAAEIRNVEPVFEGHTLGTHGSFSAPIETTAFESWMALPRSRQLTHTLTVTKRCLHLENKVASLEHDVAFKQKQIERLQSSLHAAREVLNNNNSPYIIIEKTVERLYQENESLKDRLKLSENEQNYLKEKLQQRTEEVRVLCKHRSDLMKMKALLCKMGIPEKNEVADPQKPTNNSEGDRPSIKASEEKTSSIHYTSSGPQPRATPVLSFGRVGAKPLSGLCPGGADQVLEGADSYNDQPLGLALSSIHIVS